MASRARRLPNLLLALPLLWGWAACDIELPKVPKSSAGDAGETQSSTIVRSTAASRAELIGVVLDRDSRAPIAGATVSVARGGTAQADARGLYRLSASTGHALVSISTPEHVPWQQEVPLTGAGLELNVRLQKKAPPQRLRAGAETLLEHDGTVLVIPPDAYAKDAMGSLTYVPQRRIGSVPGPVQFTDETETSRRVLGLIAIDVPMPPDVPVRVRVPVSTVVEPTQLSLVQLGEDGGWTDPTPPVEVSGGMATFETRRTGAMAVTVAAADEGFLVTDAAGGEVSEGDVLPPGRHLRTAAGETMTIVSPTGETLEIGPDMEVELGEEDAPADDEAPQKVAGLTVAATARRRVPSAHFTYGSILVNVPRIFAAPGAPAPAARTRFILRSKSAALFVRGGVVLLGELPCGRGSLARAEVSEGTASFQLDSPPALALSTGQALSACVNCGTGGAMCTTTPPAGRPDAGISLPPVGERDAGRDEPPQPVDAGPQKPPVGEPDAAPPVQVDAGAGGGACHTLGVDGVPPARLTNALDTPLPRGTGGPIRTGTYRLVELRLHKGATSIWPAGLTIQSLMQLGDGQYRAVEKVGTGAEARSAGSFAVEGNRFFRSLICPTVEQASYEFSADDTGTVSIIDTGAAAVAVYMLDGQSAPPADAGAPPPPPLRDAAEPPLPPDTRANDGGVTGAAEAGTIETADAGTTGAADGGSTGAGGSGGGTQPPYVDGGKIDPPPPPPPADAGPASAYATGTGPAVDAGVAACSPLTTANTPAVVPTLVDDPLPDATGGDLVPGRYQLVAIREHAGAVLPQVDVHAVLQVGAGLKYEAADRQGPLAERTTAGVAYLEGTTIIREQSCPMPAADKLGYSVNGATLTLLDPASGVEYVYQSLTF